MKKVFAVLAAITLATLVSCQKQQTEAEKNAEIERQVQERLAAEHQTEQQQQLQQRQTDLDAREKALAEKENAAATPASRREQVESEPYASQSRVREPRESAPARGYSTFYTKLEPHGAWFESSDYGYVWQPREAESSRAWRPYTNGRWVYTDVGWTWISEEPFGWATYHYGRWTRLRGIGWVWVPGNEWAPAWVSWRKSSDYVGWAPLPPEARFDQRTGIHNWSDNYYDIGPDQYCFVASREFGAPRVETTLLPSERNVQIVNQTTNITNITYNNTTIVNEGPSYEEIRAQSREQVQRFRLERNVNVDVSTEPSRPVVQGETVVLAAPVIAAPIAAERPRTVKQTVAKVAVDLGWEAIADHEAAKKAREKMKSEATPPPNAPSKKFTRVTAAAAPPTQGGQTSAASTSASGTATPIASATITPTVAPAVTESATPTPRMTPGRVATPERSPMPFASPAISASPTAAQRRGRLLVPSTPTPSAKPRPATSTSPTPVAAKPAAPETISSPPPIATAPAEAPVRGKVKSQGQQFNARGVGATASPAAALTSSSSVTPGASPTENLTKKEKKEQKREEKKELKRERKEAAQQTESASPTATPQ